MYSRKVNLTLIYKSDEPNDIRALSYIECLRNYNISTIDVSKQKLPQDKLEEIAGMLNVKPVDLINNEQEWREVNEMGPDGNKVALKDLKKDQKLLRTPITIIGKKADFWENAGKLRQK